MYRSYKDWRKVFVHVETYRIATRGTVKSPVSGKFQREDKKAHGVSLDAGRRADARVASERSAAIPVPSALP